MAKRLIDADKFLQWVVKRFKCVPLAKPDIAYAIKTDIAFQIAKSLLSNGVTFREE